MDSKRSEEARQPITQVCRSTITAHAGCMQTPMDSLEAIEAGVTSGADIVEVDVRFWSDGTPVLAHNEESAGRDAVMLADALALLGRLSDHVCINLDIKDSCALHRLPEVAHLARKFLSVEQKGIDGCARAFLTGLGEKACMSEQLQTCGLAFYVNTDLGGGNDPDGEEAQTACAAAIEIAKKSGAQGLNFNIFYATETVICAIHAAGLLASVWTANQAIDVERMLSRGADNVTTRIPDVAILLREKINDRNRVG